MFLGVTVMGPSISYFLIEDVVSGRRALISDRAGHLLDLASRAARWTSDHEKELLRLDPVMPGGLFNRRADVWRPLVAIAEVAGGAWPERVRTEAAALESSAADETESITVMLFGDIRAAFEKYGDDKMPSADLARYLNEMEDRPWPEYGRSRKPITAVQIARLLKRHTISPNTIRLDDRTPRGYHLDQFKDVFARYLPPSKVQHRHNPQKTAKNGSFQGETLGSDVAPWNPPKPAVALGCGGVAVQNGESAAKHEKEPWRERI